MKKITLLSALLILTLSCAREKGEDRGTITITADWGNLPESDTMCFIFYPEDGGTPISYIIKDKNYTFDLPRGKYKVLFFNDDTKNIQFQNIDNYELARASVSPLSKAGITIAQPDMLYGTAIDEIVVEEGKSSENKVKVFPYTKNVIANIDLPKEDQSLVNGVTAQLKGVTSSVLLSQRRPVYEETPNETVMTTRVQPDGNVTMSCTTFGPAKEKSLAPGEVTSVIEINTVYTDNTRKTITADVSNILENIQKQEDQNQAVVGLKDMGIYAAVVNWVAGTASGTITNNMK